MRWSLLSTLRCILIPPPTLHIAVIYAKTLKRSSHGVPTVMGVLVLWYDVSNATEVESSKHQKAKRNLNVVAVRVKVKEKRLVCIVMRREGNKTLIGSVWGATQ
jgi:hypothetical protein